MATLIRLVTLLLIPLIGASAFSGNASATELFAQSAQAALLKNWSSAEFPNISWLLMDARTGQLLGSQWSDVDEPVPVGSLTKPFVALAYARTHTGFPHFICKGSSARCWLARGHGALDFEAALANSCNAYFMELAGATEDLALQQISLNYNLPAPPAPMNPAVLIGLRPDWRIAPVALSRAYARLTTQPDASPILAGLRRAAAIGTASALSSEDVLAKTGTAHCLKHCVASGDGLVVVLIPADDPRLVLLVRDRGATGAAAALQAAEMLRSLRNRHVIP